MMQESEQSLSLPVSWVEVDQADVVAANQFAMAYNPTTGESVLTVGHVAPPMLLGTEEDVRQQAEKIQFVPIRTVGRFSMTRSIAEALREVLQQHLARYDQEQREEGER